MKMEKVLKVKLEEEEKEALKQVVNIVNDIFNKSDGCEDEIEIDDDILDMLDDLQATIRTII